MNEITHFRGKAGEVAREYLHPRTIAAAGPALLIWSVLFALIYFLGNHLKYGLAPILLLFTFSFILSQYIESAQPRLTFVYRYMGLTLIWAIPSFVWLRMLLLPEVTLLQQIFSAESSSALMFHFLGWKCVAIAVTAPILLIAPLLTAVLCLYIDRLTQIFSVDPWRWLFVEKRRDILAFIATAYGSLINFTCLALAPITLLIWLSYKINLQFGATIETFLLALPVLCFPLLIARLSLEFVSSFSNFDCQLDPILETLNAQRYDDDETSSQQFMTVTQTLITALETHRWSRATEIYLSFQTQRQRLKLDTASLQKLSQALLSENHFSHAAWCLFQASLSTDNADYLYELQKQILSIAQKAHEDDKYPEALAIHSVFSKKFPKSEFSEHIKTFIREESKFLTMVG